MSLGYADNRDLVEKFERGRVAFEAMRWDEAAAAFEAYVAIDPDNAPAWANLSMAYWRLGLIEQQLQAAQKAKSIDANAMGSLLVLSEAHFSEGDYRAALRVAREGKRLYGVDRVFHELEAKLLRALLKPEKAIEAARRAISRTPFFNTLMHLLVGNCLADIRKWDAAFKEFELVLDNYEGTPPIIEAPAPVLANAGKGRVLLIRGLSRPGRDLADLGNAITAFQKVTEWNPRDRISWAGIGVAHRFLGQYELSLSALDRAVQSGGTDGYLALQRGLTLSMLGRHAESLSQLQWARDNTDEQHVLLEALTYLPLPALSLGNDEQAMAACEDALTRGVENAIVLNSRAVVHLRRNHLDDARCDLNRAKELSPMDPVVTSNLGWLEVELGNYEEGDKLIDEAISLRSLGAPVEGARVLVAKFLSLIRQGHQEDAQALMEWTRQELAPRPDLLAQTLADMEHVALQRHLALALDRIDALESTLAEHAQPRPQHRWRRRLADFQELLEKPGVREEEVKQFLKSEESRFFFGSDCSRVLTEHELGSEFRPDFVLQYPASRYLLVEIENPNRRPYTRRGDPSAGLSHARQQVEDWQRWIEENNSYAQRRLPGCASPEGLVVIGRRRDLSEDMQGRLARSNVSTRGHFRIVTYDDLLETASNIIGNLERADQFTDTGPP